MSQKAALLKAVRDELKARVPEVANRVFVVVQDAQGNVLLPQEAQAPFLTVADGGLELDWVPGQTALATYLVTVRAYVQDLRDNETPVIGHPTTSTRGAAELQGLITAALEGNRMPERITGLQLARTEREPAVDIIGDENWWAVTGDVQLRYAMTESVG